MTKLTHNELVKLIREANKDKDIFLVEASYNRVRDHIEKGNAFTIITSDRHERSSKENRRMFQQMKQDYKAAGFPFTELKGGFKETTKIEIDPETGEEVEVRLEEPKYVLEDSILVTTHTRPDIGVETTALDLRNFSSEMAKKYSQEAYIFGEVATTSSGENFQRIRAYSKEGGIIKEPWAGPWDSVETVEQDSDFWSRVKGKYFQLKEVEKEKTSQPKSWIEAIKKSRSGENW
tara:strand:- start:809 stop:1510 length:702 start_codon:yes stop_codon:yes gene_type:complete